MLSCWRTPAGKAGRYCVFEKLGQRLRVAGTVLAAAAVGSGGTWLARRRPDLLPPLSKPRLRDRLFRRLS